MAIPVPIPVGALPVTDPDTVRAESLVAAITQIFKNGTSGGTLAIGTPATIIPPGANPPIDPATGKPLLETLTLDTPQAQLFYRQLALAMAKIVPGWTSSPPSPVVANLVFNEVPVGAVNGSNKTFTTSNVFIVSTTRFFLNGQRLLLGTDYIENAGYNSVTITALFPAPRSGDNIVMDYVRP